jgi:hypothetical protein
MAILMVLLSVNARFLHRSRSPKKQNGSFDDIFETSDRGQGPIFARLDALFSGVETEAGRV